MPPVLPRALPALALALWSAAACDASGGGAAPARAQAPAEPVAAFPAGVDGTARMAALGCGGCHAGVGPPVSATDLAPGAGPRDPASLYVYLADSLPTRPRADGARMPDFRLTDAEALALALHLGRGRAAREARDAFERARDAHPDIDAATGARLYTAFRCAACHGPAGERPPADAPSLAEEGERVRATWLHDFLRAPHAVRPFGATPGSGARMPDFGLSDDDVEAIAATLLAGEASLPEFAPLPPSTFAARKVETLMRERYDCLGCHALNGDGGRIAPDLARAAARLLPAYIAAMLDDPDALVPGTVMPKPRLTAGERNAIAHYLATRDTGELVATAYLSPLEHATLPASSTGTEDGAALYVRRCAACHGVNGRGDGFNASFLPTRPTVHADADAMADRPDDTLHDGIAAGGRILGRSARMPAFGASLAPAEIRALVTHIRTLCACSPPAWSTDGAR